MDQKSYDSKLAQLIEIFQGDQDYAKTVLDRWLHLHRAEFEAQVVAEVSRRLEGLNSIIPITLKVTIDSQGVQVPGSAPPPAPTQARRSSKKAAPAES
jgi:hypothetical protein